MSDKDSSGSKDNQLVKLSKGNLGDPKRGPVQRNDVKIPRPTGSVLLKVMQGQESHDRQQDELRKAKAAKAVKEREKQIKETVAKGTRAPSNSPEPDGKTQTVVVSEDVTVTLV